jgi:hypothetical protein
VPGPFGLSYRTWGTLLFAAVYGFTLLVYWRRGTDRTLLWACLAASFALFMLSTRVHERYLLSAGAFAALVAGISPKFRWFYLGLSATFVLNLLWSYNRYFPVLKIDPLYTSGLFVRALSLLNLGLLAYLLFPARKYLELQSNRPKCRHWVRGILRLRR